MVVVVTIVVVVIMVVTIVVAVVIVVSVPEEVVVVGVVVVSVARPPRTPADVGALPRLRSWVMHAGRSGQGRGSEEVEQ